jgi:purine-nucleoside phosphorylase
MPMVLLCMHGILICSLSSRKIHGDCCQRSPRIFNQRGHFKCGSGHSTRFRTGQSGRLADGQEASTHSCNTALPGIDHPGHFGNLVAGKRNGRRIIALQGRTHYYEGYSQQSITFGIRLFKALGAKVLILTNAAGAVNTGFRPGDLMVVDDHINAFWDNPLRGGHNPAEGPRFPDMSSPYDQKLIRLLEDTAQENRIAMRKGVLYGLSGPTYETAAEVRMIRILGGDTANMSTVPECIMANYLGLRVCAISLITNMATGLSVQPLSHEEVTAVGRQANGKMLLLLKEFINKLILQNEI